MYKIMLYGGLLGTVIMLVITFFIFIKGNVLEVIQDLLGIKNTKKTLNKNKAVNNTTGNIKPTVTNVYSKPIDLKIEQVISKGFDYTEDEENTIILGGDEETELLDGDEEETELLSEENEETTILGFAEETEILSSFTKEVDVMIVNSNVII